MGAEKCSESIAFHRFVKNFRGPSNDARFCLLFKFSFELYIEVFRRLTLTIPLYIYTLKSRLHLTEQVSEIIVSGSERLNLFIGFQRQGTPNGSHNGNGNAMRDPISPVHNDSSDYKYGEINCGCSNNKSLSKKLFD